VRIEVKRNGSLSHTLQTALEGVRPWRVSSLRPKLTQESGEFIQTLPFLGKGSGSCLFTAENEI